MSLNDFRNLKINKEEAKKHLLELLQNAHAGEKAAANAYYGHACSRLFISKKEQVEILAIYKDELHHRERLYAMLLSLDAKPRFFRELGMFAIGFTIGLLCLFGGWFIPMYGAAKLENENVEEYEVAARLALLAGYKSIIEELLVFAEVEWDHELYFRGKAQKHWLAKHIKLGPKLKPRDQIRADFETFNLKIESVKEYCVQ